MMRLSTSQLSLQLEEMKAERKVLLDRLATIGLGGPLFTLPPSQDSSLVTEAEAELTEEEQERQLMDSLRRTPSKLARFLEWKAQRDRNRRNRRPDVAYIVPETQSAELKQVEQAASSMSGADFLKFAHAAIGKKKQA